jgi:hypothetical protein
MWRFYVGVAVGMIAMLGAIIILDVLEMRGDVQHAITQIYDV